MLCLEMLVLCPFLTMEEEYSGYKERRFKALKL